MTTALETKVRSNIAAIQAAFPVLDLAEANCVRMNRYLKRTGGQVSYFPYETGKLTPAVEAATIPGYED